MLICNTYWGGTDRLSGFVYDTEKKTYKEFSLAGETWAYSYIQKGNIYSHCKDGFKLPADIEYAFGTKSEMKSKLFDIQQLGFKEDTNMVLDFGLCVV